MIPYKWLFWSLIRNKLIVKRQGFAEKAPKQNKLAHKSLIQTFFFFFFLEGGGGGRNELSQTNYLFVESCWIEYFLMIHCYMSYIERNPSAASVVPFLMTDAMGRPLRLSVCLFCPCLDCIFPTSKFYCLSIVPFQLKCVCQFLHLMATFKNKILYLVAILFVEPVLHVSVCK